MSNRETITEGDYTHAVNGLNANRVFISVARTINLGNYESIRVEYGAGKSLEKGETREQAKNILWVEVLQSISEMEKMIESMK